MVALTVSLLVSLAWSGAAVRLGPPLGFVDVPDDPDLKVHEIPAVPLGGVGVFAAVHLGLLVADSVDVGLLLATGLLLLVGLADDRSPLPPLLRLLVEAVAGVLLVLLGDLAFPGDDVAVGVVGVVLVVLCVNAVNLFDGLDGMVGASMIIAGLGMAALSDGGNVGAEFGYLLAAAVAGFLVFNWSPARVFLGDNGAYVAGGFLAYGILVTSTGGLGYSLVVSLGLLGVFGLDLLVTVVRRRLHRRPLFGGDRSHLYDQLRDRGLSVPVVAVGAAAVQALFVLAVILADYVGGWAGALIVIGLSSALLVLAWIGGLVSVKEA